MILSGNHQIEQSDESRGSESSFIVIILVEMVHIQR